MISSTASAWEILGPQSRGQIGTVLGTLLPGQWLPLVEWVP